MAAAIIPIIAAAYPLLKPIAQDIIMGVEHLFGKGQGPSVKFPTAVNALMAVAQALGTAGLIPGQLDGTHIASIVQGVFQELKDAGIVNPETAAALAAQPMGVSTLPPGTLRISGGTLQLSFG